MISVWRGASLLSLFSVSRWVALRVSHGLVVYDAVDVADITGLRQIHITSSAAGGSVLFHCRSRDAAVHLS